MTDPAPSNHRGPTTNHQHPRPAEVGERPDAQASWGARDRALIGVNVTAMVVIAVVIYVLINFVSYHEYARADWTASKLHTISPETKAVLEGLSEDIQVLTVSSLRNEIETEIDSLVRSLLEQYRAASSHVKLEFVDADLDREKAMPLVKQYDLSQANVVIFARGDRKKVIDYVDLADIDPGQGGPFGGGMPRITAFKGENEFSSALRALTEVRRQTVYFLEGHGEAKIDDFREEGLSELDKRLKRDNYQTQSLNLVQATNQSQVPEDCDVLVIAAPDKNASAEELEAIRRYLAGGGRLLLLANELDHSNLYSLVEDYGITLPDEQRILVETDRRRFANFPAQLVASDNLATNHDITHAIRREGITVFTLARRLLIEAAKVPGTKVTKLANTSEGCVALEVVEGRPQQGTDDPIGPLCYGASVEVAGSAPTRIVVWGDADFAFTGTYYTTGISLYDNEELLSNMVDWLAGKGSYFDIPPKHTEKRTVVLTGEHEQQFFVFAVLAMPLIMGVGLGGAIWFFRRR